jgi:hypothetical protein
MSNAATMCRRPRIGLIGKGEATEQTVALSRA